ncbi:hypothetical protein PROFUN_16046 [Planoprotostelium fungivorum]|uniref:Uncharacterized protein n=1 Tax=Planoprotostelium fungivorum TaxID=1890364 RepID=A0A2P6MST2_9EUKA|nr:hypothetical protein PROFUN_16046 [Planoprotostelium fungivorum]
MFIPVKLVLMLIISEVISFPIAAETHTVNVLVAGLVISITVTHCPQCIEHNTGGSATCGYV